MWNNTVLSPHLCEIIRCQRSWHSLPVLNCSLLSCPHNGCRDQNHATLAENLKSDIRYNYPPHAATRTNFGEKRSLVHNMDVLIKTLSLKSCDFVSLGDHKSSKLFSLLLGICGRYYYYQSDSRIGLGFKRKLLQLIHQPTIDLTTIPYTVKWEWITW
jgi:hypothetical protein